DYAEVAHIVGKSEANCRQILRRARQSLAARRPRFAASPQQRERLLHQFVQVSANGDLQGLLALLAQDVTLWSDGGGKAAAALNPISGSAKVARFIVGALRKLVPANRSSRLAEINGQPGIISYVDHHPQSALTLDLTEDHIQTIYIISNPDKLRGLPLAS
ncbi:MAG: RNA polymerase sigma-70 factor, partial [Candidatus Binatia bacterium]